MSVNLRPQMSVSTSPEPSKTGTFSIENVLKLTLIGQPSMPARDPQVAPFSHRRNQHGLTLVEMVVVVSIIGLVAAISFPSISSSLESLRLRGATDSIVSFLNGGMNRAERRQQIVEVIISKSENAILLRSADPGFQRRLDMPEGITIAKIHPEMLSHEETARSYILYSGGTIPGFGVEIANRKGTHRIVRVDPITGVPEVQLQ